MKTMHTQASHVGQRSCNEDALGALPTHQLYMVCDGMGGHSSGEVASSLAVATVEEVFMRWGAGQEHGGALDVAQATQLFDEAIKLANQRIIELGEHEPMHRGMGTTIAAMAIVGQQVLTAHAGDSRVYRIRHGELTQLTQDHSLYNELKAHGHADLPAPEDFAYRNVIVRAIGIRQQGFEPELASYDAMVGDVYILCSDGLYEQLNMASLPLLLKQATAQEAHKLVMAALEAGSHDNISAIIVRCEGA